MKLKKLLALTLTGAVLTASLTACTPLDAAELVYDWLFGGGSSNASHGSKEGVVKESDVLENQLRTRFGLSETTASDRAKKTLEEVAEKFDATWLDPDNNELNDKAKDALIPITQGKLDVWQALLVDVMELTPSGGTAFDTSGDRKVYMDEYWDKGPYSGGLAHDYPRVSYSDPELGLYRKDGAELYAGTFQKDGKTYAAMVTIMKINKNW